MELKLISLSGKEEGSSNEILHLFFFYPKGQILILCVFNLFSVLFVCIKGEGLNLRSYRYTGRSNLRSYRYTGRSN